MSEKRKSFFERFVKTKKTEKRPKTAAQEENVSIPKSEAKPSKNSTSKENKENQDEWASSYEGQLTIDVFQTENDIVIKSTIAGVTPENIDVTIDNDMVTIKGERKNDIDIPKENYFYQECYWGAFSRSVILPCDIETEKVRAELKNGILTVTLPKANKAKTRKISVKAG